MLQPLVPWMVWLDPFKKSINRGVMAANTCSEGLFVEGGTAVYPRKIQLSFHFAVFLGRQNRLKFVISKAMHCVVQWRSKIVCEISQIGPDSHKIMTIRRFTLNEAE